ncbi:MAG: hypothetical protein OEY16_09365 [Alphaproteobacteria bacterium]|nr:hypothetical protein [Alphaproteobacteria bacterium]
MRSSVIVMLFLFSMLFLGAQAAQMDPPKSAAQAPVASASHADAGMLQPVGFVPDQNN